MLWYLIVVIVVMSCFIAYLGDNLGRHVGKQRLILFGLRPKHTAILITVITGMLISVVTLGAMMGLDRSVRRALLQYDEIEQALQDARADNQLERGRAYLARCEADRDEKALQNSELRLAAAQSREKAANQLELHVSSQLAVSQGDLQREIQAMNQAETRKVRLEHEMSGLRQVNSKLEFDRQRQSLQLAAAHRDIQTLGMLQIGLKSDMVHLRNDVSNLRAARFSAEQGRKQVASDLEHTRGLLLTEKGLLSDAQQRVQNLTGQELLLQGKVTGLQGKVTSLQGTVTSLQSTNEALESTSASLKSTNQTLGYTNDSLQALNDTLSIKNTGLLLQIQRAETSLRRTTDIITRLVANHVIFEPAQVLAREVIDTDVPREDLKSAVEKLVASAEDSARQAGGADTNGDGHALRLMATENTTLTHDQVLKAFVDHLVAEHGKRVVGVQALLRFVRGDEVLAGLYDAPDEQIYSAGETIASMQLDGRQPESEIRKMIVAFLSDKVRPAALDKGLQPDANDNISTDILDKILTISQEVHRRRRIVHFAAVASQDTWCTQPLDITFLVS